MNYNPQNTIITFDLHGVVFKQDNKQILKHVLKSDQKLRMFAHLLNPRFTFDVLKLLWRKTVVEKMFWQIAHKYPFFEKKIPLALRVANAQQPITETVQIIEQLKANGYEVHILSNIGQTVLHDLRQQFPDLLNLFDVAQVAHAGNGYLGKPDPRVFKEYLRTHNKKNKQIIFIDDKQKNIDAGSNYGMHGILFKNSEYVRNALEHCGVL